MSEWIDWSGGECPVSDGTRVDVRFRAGFAWDNERADQLSDDFRSWWEHAPNDQGPDDIIAYRVVFR